MWLFGFAASHEPYDVSTQEQSPDFTSEEMGVSGGLQDRPRFTDLGVSGRTEA